MTLYLSHEQPMLMILNNILHQPQNLEELIPQNI